MPPAETLEIVTASAITPPPLPAAPTPAVQPETASADPVPASSAAETRPWSQAEAPRPGVDTDRGGAPFDPVRHNAKLHPHSGRWMPRKRRSASGVTLPASPSAVASPKPAAPAVSFIPAEIPPAEPAEDTPERKETPAAPAAVDHAADAGEVMASGAQFVAGLVFDAPEDCTATPAQHRHMVNACAAWLRARGLQIAAGAGLLLMFAAWLLSTMRKPKVHARLREMLGYDAAAAARNVTPVTATPATSAAAPAAETSTGLSGQKVIPPLAQ